MADVASGLAGNKMLLLKQEMAALREAIASCTDEEEKKRLRRALLDKETYYNILADRMRLGY